MSRKVAHGPLVNQRGEGTASTKHWELTAGKPDEQSWAGAALCTQDRAAPQVRQFQARG